MIYLGHDKRSTHKHDWDDATTTHMVSHMAKHGISREREAIIKLEQPVSTEYKATLSKFWSMGKPFPIDTFKAAFMTWVICDNIKVQANTFDIYFLSLIYQLQKFCQARITLLVVGFYLHLQKKKTLFGNSYLHRKAE